MAVGSTVRWFHSEQADAPQIQAQPGDLLAILEACLISGFGNKSVDGIEVVDEVATVTISGGHDFERHAVVRIAGADQSALNGDWRVTGEPTGSMFSFAAPGVENLTATGTMTCRRAPPGYWEKAFSSDHKAAFRSTHPDATGFYLRIDDSATGTGASPVRGYETMTDIDTGDRPFPTVAQQSALTWLRSGSTLGSVLPRPWTLICDERFFALLVHNYQFSSYGPSFYQFGDSARGDNFSCMITGHANAAPWGANAFANFASAIPTLTLGAWFARGEAIADDQPVPYGRAGSQISVNLAGGQDFPAAISGGYLFQRDVLALGQAKVRGMVPGLLLVLTSPANSLPAITNVTVGRVIVEPTAEQPNPVLLTHICAGGAGSSGVSACAWDIQGPWR